MYDITYARAYMYINVYIPTCMKRGTVVVCIGEEDREVYIVVILIIPSMGYMLCCIKRDAIQNILI